MKKLLPAVWPSGVKTSTTSTEPAGAAPVTGTVNSVRFWSATLTEAVPIGVRLPKVSGWFGSVSTYRLTVTGWLPVAPRACSTPNSISVTFRPLVRPNELRSNTRM